jgi:hypothetical protein
VSKDQLILIKIIFLFNDYSNVSLWRNRLARSAVNRKVGGSSPPRDVFFSQYKKHIYILSPAKCGIKGIADQKSKKLFYF